MMMKTDNSAAMALFWHNCNFEHFKLDYLPRDRVNVMKTGGTRAACTIFRLR